MMKKKILSKEVLLAAAAVLVMAGVAYWSAKRLGAGASPAGAPGAAGSGPGGAGGAPPVKLFEVRKSSFTDVIGGLIGTIKGDTITLTYSGPDEPLVAVHARVGQNVRRGDLLFELDHARAEARKSQAEVAYQRMAQLRQAGGATARDVKESKAAFDIAAKDYEDTYVRAPKNGAVSDINKRVGETLSRNEILGVVVSNEDKLVMETGVVESQLGRVSRGNKAVVRIEALGGEPVAGTVMGVSQEVTTTGRTGTVLIALPDAVQAKLRPGLSARAEIVTYSNTTVVIPFQAFDTQNRRVFVFEEGKATPRAVELGHVTHDFYEVLSGLQEGDRIVKDLTASPVKENDAVSPDGEPDTFTSMTQPQEAK